MKRLLISLVVVFVAASSALAAPVTMNFSASGFDNGGTQYPGFNGPISGSISWDTASLLDPIINLLGIDLTIYGHTYTLGEVAVANNGATQTAIGGIVRGANAVVGDGAFHDFLFIFDRVNPSIAAFAYSIQGKTGAIWWTPAQTDADFVTADAPEPSSIALMALALLTLGVWKRAPRG